MLSILAAWQRRLKQWFTRVSWVLSLLSLKRATHNPDARGLLLLQIDGLSEKQFRRALDAGRMPFLKRLLAREDYLAHEHYSGQPSTTPAVQGELFYGRHSAVPAFAFRDRHTSEPRRMVQAAAVARVEAELAGEADGLLKGGSSYSNIYTGGAREGHFSPATLGWGKDRTLSWRGLRFALIVLLHISIIIRALALGVIESMLAIIDLFRGTLQGQSLRQELAFIPIRVGICVVMRELIVLGVRLDVARGLPVIHANLIGYDEQSHRRGPTSRFAHWTLKGIDDSIKRLWHAARKSEARDYEVWIYSDHGQEEAVPYEQLHGKSIHDAVEESCRDMLGDEDPELLSQYGVRHERAAWLDWSWLSRLLHRRRPEPSPSDWIIPSGPICHVYLPDNCSDNHAAELAEQLANEAQVPIVLISAGNGEAAAWTAAGKFSLPQDSAAVFGEKHPSLDEVVTDLLTALEHPDSGNLILLGWRPDDTTVTFVWENGSHGGPGSEETVGFFMAPRWERAIPAEFRLRPELLRHAALKVLGRRRKPVELLPDTPPRDHGQDGLRLMTYNIHAGQGIDGRYSLKRLARLIDGLHPDLVCLQEVDVNCRRSGGVDQAQVLSELTGMEHIVFHPLLDREGGKYGDAVLSRLPLQSHQTLPMDGPRIAARWEPRGVIWVEVEINGQPLQILNTHLGVRNREIRVQLELLLSQHWLQAALDRGPTVLCGDFNLLPFSNGFQKIREHLRDVQSEFTEWVKQPTFPASWPMLRLDYIFLSKDVKATGIEIPGHSFARAASDHLPVVADLQVEADNRTGANQAAAAEACCENTNAG